MLVSKFSINRNSNSGVSKINPFVNKFKSSKVRTSVVWFSHKMQNWKFGSRIILETLITLSESNGILIKPCVQIWKSYQQ